MRPRHVVILVGFGLAAIGVWRDNRIITWLAIAVLLVAFILRLIDFRRGQR